MGIKATRRSGVAEQCLEAIVHVLLDVAVKQRETRLVGDQSHRGASECGNDHRILHHAGSRLAVDLDDLEQVPVDVHRVAVVTSIVKYQPVAASLPEHEFAFVRIFLAVDEPVIDPMGTARHFFENHVDGLVWRGMRGESGRRFAKNRVIPARARRRKPNRALLLIGVLHDNPHPGLLRDVALFPCKIQTFG